MTEPGLFESLFSVSGPAWDLSVFGPKGAGAELKDTCDQLKTFSAIFRVLNPDTPDTAVVLIARLEPGGDLNEFDPEFLRMIIERILSERGLLLKTKLLDSRGAVVDQSRGAWHLATRDAFNLDAKRVSETFVRYAAHTFRKQGNGSQKAPVGGGAAAKATEKAAATATAGVAQPARPPPKPAAPPAPAAAARGPGFCVSHVLTSCFPRVTDIEKHECTRGPGCRFKHSVAELRAQPAAEKDRFKAVLDRRLAGHPDVLAAVNSQYALTGFN